MACAKPHFVNEGPPFVNDLTPPSTLRQLRAHLAQPQVAIIMAGIAIILGLSGPFQTFASQGLPERMLYWVLVVWLTYAAGFVVTLRLSPFVQRHPLPIRSLAIALAVAIVVFCLLLALNTAFGMAPTGLRGIIASFGAIFLICLVIEIAAQSLAATPTAPAAAPAAADAATGPPAILSRLPMQKRGDLLSLSVQDHYVDVVTTRGREMLLMRLGDAIRETAPVTGLQVHRSHWVARAAVTAAERRGDGALLTLTNGAAIPVSRAYVPALRKAGLLPQKGA
ncbi:MAG: LytTR family transcriptional regulator [Rhodobacteraceae bacterium]|jgi:DNA-binding LytR/AlgR family response regulator|nr:LytTR family transcriptional regulator [Paracoccaceae bacterium]